MNSGDRVAGRYVLTGHLATGGMGEVWRATDEVLDREVAVKVLKPEYADDPTFIARFRAEARSTATLTHPGIAQVYDYGEQDPLAAGAPKLAYLVLELVPGEPLSALLAHEGPLAPERTLDITAQTAAALDAAHRVGIVHRDVKPGNLLITPDGRVKVTDFGIARARDAVPLTGTGMVVGTAHYLAPEIVGGQPATPASDIYALGVVTYESLAGHRPFNGDSPVTVALAHAGEEPPPLPPAVPPAVRELVSWCMSKNPAHRPRSAGELATRCRELAALGAVALAAVAPGTVADFAAAPGPAGGGTGELPLGGGDGAAGMSPGAGSGAGPGTVPIPLPGDAAPLAAGSAAGGRTVEVGGYGRGQSPPRSPREGSGAGFGDGAANGGPTAASSARAARATRRRSRRGPLAWILPVLCVLAVLAMFQACQAGPGPSGSAESGSGDSSGSSGSRSGGGSATSARPTGSPSARTVTVSQRNLVGQTRENVEETLRDLGVRVQVRTVPGSGTVGTVSDVEPSGSVSAGTTVTVTVVGAGSGDGAGSDDAAEDEGGGAGGGDDSSPGTTDRASPAPGRPTPRTTGPGTGAGTPDPSTSAAERPAPRTTAPRTTAPQTTAPRTTAPRTTAPRTTAPRTTAPRTTAPRTTAPRTTAPETSASSAPDEPEPAATSSLRSSRTVTSARPSADETTAATAGSASSDPASS